jgi:hypothetical protein
MEATIPTGHPEIAITIRSVSDQRLQTDYFLKMSKITDASSD